MKRSARYIIPSSQITQESAYLNRRSFIKSAGLAMAAPGMLLGAAGEVAAARARAVDDPTLYADIISYNNYYEFSQEKTAVAALAHDLVTDPWSVSVEGLVKKPRKYDIDDLKKSFGAEQRIYRMRCVEGWSMVIPWDGFELSRLITEADPQSEAKYVKFTTLLDPKQMPGQRKSYFSWPYVEGLRLDEAMNSLTLLATGIYGKPLLPQNGAPVRLVVPWKYGFKGIKSIVKIELVARRPVSLWMNTSSAEYGFYANVNPNVDHPRWSQRTERRIGDLRRVRTMMFNGYEKEVADMYKGMDLARYF
ncbi:MAG: protein-methionine-sulfoxide reductase catalytic subunit MsrP [Nitrospinota bacterium]|nr:protein-methionine-sulfoxide reductase catalytic subunit MsrP [Nitrospinota bacterium]